MNTVRVNFNAVHTAFPLCSIDSVAEFYTPKDRWTGQFEGEPLCRPERGVEDQLMLALLAGATSVSLTLIDTHTGRRFQEQFKMRELVN